MKNTKKNSESNKKLNIKKQKIPRISTRGYYDLTNGKKMKKKPYHLYPKKIFQKLYGKKEITIMIHGLRNNRTDALQKFMIAQKRLKQIGYLYPVIGFSYDANIKRAHIKKYELKALRVGQKIAKQNGRNLSKFLIDFKKKSPKTKIRLIGHSLGTEVIASTIVQLAKNKKNHNIIESVHFFGSSLNNNFANSKKYGKSMQNIISKKIKNYYSPSDEVLKLSHLEGSIKKPLGFLGASGKTIPKFVQKKVFPKNHRFLSYAAVLTSFP